MAPLRMGMVGGGEGAFIGEIHRAAARLDGDIELVCGAFSSDPERARRSGAALGLPADRVYATWQDMLATEAELPRARRMQFVSVVTPNDLHFPIAMRALELGFHVLSDKPATRTTAEALELAQAVKRSRCCYALTHTYLGYPMVCEARARVMRGEVGIFRWVTVRYAQGWLARRLETQGNRQAEWRTDPARAGAAGSVGDIGVHAFNLTEYITGVPITQLCADLGTAVPNRMLDDHGAAFLRFENGARGMLTVSQISTGEDNDLTIGVYGENGGVVWTHRHADCLRLTCVDGTSRILRSGNNGEELDPATRGLCRAPMGHPEGYIEAFANLYHAFAADVRACREASLRPPCSPAQIDSAVRGMMFIEAMVRSSRAGQRWVTVDDVPGCQGSA